MSQCHLGKKEGTIIQLPSASFVPKNTVLASCNLLTHVPEADLMMLASTTQLVVSHLFASFILKMRANPYNFNVLKYTLHMNNEDIY